MPTLPHTESAPVIRTDFSDDATWRALCDQLRAPVSDFGMDFYASLEFIDDQAFAGLTSEQLLALATDGFPHSFLLIADTTTMQHEEHPLLVLDLLNEPGRTFRAVPQQIQGIENNLSIANMDFFEFADSADPQDGIFRGFV